ncbi:Putative peptidoglycan binding domain protein [Polymorphum gilvum SL003B-26A1]|uniref:Putative peptidoglycan binding domain protein n=2 Tax=Polymorphum TaxID=991903 RepID=F2IV39_POLGS|nr:Putative peptidoglycan binding domain protein [Polymorphum gilvum SL003B-26A1]
MIARAGNAALDNPVAAGGSVVMALTGCLIVANAVGLQPGRHPAPLLITRERPAAIATAEERTVATLPVSALVLDIQTELRRLGLYEGLLDGLVGPATERAVRRYELQAGLPETGEATAALLARLTMEPDGTVLSSDPGVPVPRRSPLAAAPVAAETTGSVPAQDRLLMRVQQVLSDLGYGPLRADGLMGDNTASAIQRFELDRGLPITGRVNPTLVERLEQVSGVSIQP